MKLTRVLALALGVAVVFPPVSFVADCGRASGRDDRPADSPGADKTVGGDESQKGLSPGIESLWRSHISAPQERSGADDGFSGTMKALKSVRFKTAPPRVAAPGPEAEGPSTAPTTRPAKISDEVIAELKRASMKGQVDCELLADALRMAGYEKHAAELYLHAVGRNKDPDEQAFLLFVAGNCLCRKDPEAAIECYDELTQGYPKTIWARLADVQSRIIQWRKTNQVGSLLDSVTDQIDDKSPQPTEIANR